MAGSSVKLSLLADASRLKAGLAEADRAMQKTEDQTSKLDKKLSDFAKFAVAGLAAGAGAAIVSFATDSVRAFSDLEQSVGGTEAVFGDASGAINEFASKSAEAIGLSEAEFRTATTQIGGQLKRMTGDVEFAADKSVELTGVAADLAATYGGTTKEAVEALGAAFRGEADPAERFNLNLKQGEVNAKAVELGLARTTSEVDENAKAQATLALIMEQSADAQGQFAQEADSLAGSMQIAQAAVEDFKAQLGEALAPVVAEATGAFTDLLGITSILTEEMMKLGEGESSVLGTVTNSLLDMVPGVGLVKNAWEIATTVWEEAHGWLQDLTGASDDNTDALDANERAAWAAHLTGDELAATEEGIAEETATATERLREQFDLIDGRIGSMENLAEAVDEQNTAQFNLNKARQQFGEDSPEYLQAVEDAAAANRDVRDAQIALIEQGGLTRAEFEHQQRELGLTIDQARILADQYEGLFTPRHVTHTIRFNNQDPNRRTSGAHSGGIVPGSPGTPVDMTLLAGERVIPIGHVNGNGHGSGTIINLTVQALDPAGAAKAVVQALQSYNRTNGGVPITVRTP